MQEFQGHAAGSYRSLAVHPGLPSTRPDLAPDRQKTMPPTWKAAEPCSAEPTTAWRLLYAGPGTDPLHSPWPTVTS